MAGQKKVDLPGVVLGNILVPRPRRLREAKRAGELTRKIQGKMENSRKKCGSCEVEDEVIKLMVSYLNF